MCYLVNTSYLRVFFIFKRNGLGKNIDEMFDWDHSPKTINSHTNIQYITYATADVSPLVASKKKTLQASHSYLILITCGQFPFR